jgi:hypothetical protein
MHLRSIDVSSEALQMNPTVTENKLKCVTVMVFEENGKTIIQPIIRGQDTQHLHDLFQKNSLEVWLPNGKPEFEQFDIGIVKYKQISQRSKTRNQSGLESHFESLPLNQQGSDTEEPQTKDHFGHAQLPNLSFRLRRLGRCST